ncbi:aromatic ring-hydroxylating dioxygenase subunit alpha [Sphingobium sp.]|uniref:aromatic ring-hydroxylating dioxygenase subunit alpha n=1 Tax=Sphingobium sp. TaxID=1912891 RepID=UPI0028BE1557|nr:aromatic ring-hydroxylating dioxygenase subunit alpha [Sphingobium sp.]
MTQSLADHTTPFVRDEWYVAALSSEIDRRLQDRKILGIGVLLYRCEDGTAVALHNRCPHRSFPLSSGKLVGDTVTCGYHGLAFGSDGRCIAVPSQSTVPKGLGTPAYPLVERALFLWIWMGDPAHADPATIPDHHWLSDPDHAGFTGYIHCRSNYIRLHENVLDLTHFPYLHGDAVGDVTFSQLPFRTERKGHQVVVTRKDEGRVINGANALIIGNEGHRCNRLSESWFTSPAFHIAHTMIEDLDGGVNGRAEFHNKIIHCFTPETQHSCHYFYAQARDVAIDRPDVTDAIARVAYKAFMEDEEALELVERTWTDEDLADYRELSVRGDLPGLHMRHIIFERAMIEKAASLPSRQAEKQPA